MSLNAINSNIVANNLYELVYKKQLNNGLKVTIIKKNDFKKVICLCAVNFGSIYEHFMIDDKEVRLQLGVSHFLEHQLFSMENNIDATNIFTALGLECNAFTDYFQTVFYFTGTKNIDKGINLLLDFVQKPYFDLSNIAKEKEIIIQEIKMYQDKPMEQLTLGLMKNMFEKYPYKNDIGGTKEDVETIDKELLTFVHSSFYHPSNLDLVIVGDVDESNIFNLIETNQANKVFPKKPNIQLLIEDDNGNNNQVLETHMDISSPISIIGVRLPMFKEVKENDIMLDELIYKIIMYVLFGNDTIFYQSLVDNNIVSGYLSTTIDVNINTGYLSVSGYCLNVEEFKKRITRRFKSLKNRKFKVREIERIKKTIIGGYLFSMNSIDNIAFAYTDYLVKKSDYFQAIDVINQLSIDEIERKAKELDLSTIYSFTIKPKEN